MSDKNTGKKVQGYLRMMEKSLNKGLVQYTFRTSLYPDEWEGKKPGKCEPFSDSERKERIKQEEGSWDTDVSLNGLLGTEIELVFDERIRCTDCGRPTKKSFNQGSCYVCFTKLASNDLCIMQPTRCHYFQGTCREPEWGEANCFQKHRVYLSITSGAKVGITKEKDPVRRWIDQGAVLAIPLLETQSRLEAGLVEKFMTEFLPDTTGWQKMVTGEPMVDQYDLEKERSKFLKAIEGANLEYLDAKGKKNSLDFQPSIEKPTRIQYPILEYPKAKSLKPNKEKPIRGKLLGIKGQYILLDGGVINLRSYQGYYVRLQF